MFSSSIEFLYEYFSTIKSHQLHLSSLFIPIILSFVITLLTTPILIYLQNKLKIFQPIRKLGLSNNELKQPTPSFGGISIILSIFLTNIICTKELNDFNIILLGVTISFFSLGFIDDFVKIKYRNTAGISGKLKIFVQLITAIIAIYFVTKNFTPDTNNAVNFLFTKNQYLNIGLFYYFFASIVIIGSSNAVNLTDGLDGLVSFPAMTSFLSFGIISFYIYQYDILAIHYINNLDVKNIIIFCACAIGAIIAFILFNYSPAKIFMGDCGSLALGGALGTISIILKQEILFVLIGLIFVIEALSVIIQVSYFKATNGKRFFKMTPIHHHFEKQGYKEQKIVLSFWLVSIICSFLGVTLFMYNYVW